jgi:hypothetical protein
MQFEPVKYGVEAAHKQDRVVKLKYCPGELQVEVLLDVDRQTLKFVSRNVPVGHPATQTLILAS